MTRRQTPQAKKAKDLTRRVDMFGENQKSSRKNIPRHRAALERAYRHAVKTEIARGGEAADPAGIRRTRWKKWVTPTLAEALELKGDRITRASLTTCASDAPPDVKANLGNGPPNVVLV